MLGDTLEDTHLLFAGRRLKTGIRLVSDEHALEADQLSGDRGLFLLTAGKLFEIMILQRGDTDLLHHVVDALIFFLLSFVAGLSYRRIGAILLIVIPAAALFLLLVTQTKLPIVKDYQRNRIMTFFEQDNEEYSESAIQQRNSVTAIGSGQITGKGLNNNKVSSSNKGNFVAELQNDFIFAVAGEELGFVGCLVIILLLLVIVLECLRMGSRAKDLAGTLICSGVAALIAIQSFINICVATGLFPNTGTPLPFVSYGLTSLWCLFIGAGLCLNVGLQHRNYYIWQEVGRRYANNA